MKEHNGVKYEHIKKDSWRLVWPSGLKSTVKASSEEELISIIKSVKQMIG